MSDTAKAAAAALTSAVQADAAKVATAATQAAAAAEVQAQGFLRRNVWSLVAIAAVALGIAALVVLH